MTPTNGVPAQKIAAAPPSKAPGDGKNPAQGAAAPDGSQDFGGIFARLTAEPREAATQPQAEAAGAEADIPSRRSAPARSKPLRPEDALPPELLLTLYPRASQPLAAPFAAADGEAPAGLPEATGNTELGASLTTGAALAMAPLSGDSLEKAAAMNAARAAGPPSAELPAFSDALSPDAPQSAAPVSATSGPEKLLLSPAVQQTVAPGVHRPEAPLRQAASNVLRSADRRVDEQKPLAASDAVSIPDSPSLDDAEKPPLPPEHVREARLTVTRQETFLPSAGLPPLAHQAAERIVAALQNPDDPAAAPQPTASLRTAEQAPVRVLHIQLQPAELGLLTVRLSLRDNALNVQLEAAEHRTARLLEADREKLSDLLRSAGYAVDGLQVQIAPADKSGQAFNALAGGGAGAPPQSGQQAQAGDAQANPQQREQRGGGPEDGGSSTSRNEEGDNAHSVRPAGGALYL